MLLRRWSGDPDREGRAPAPGDPWRLPRTNNGAREELKREAATAFQARYFDGVTALIVAASPALRVYGVHVAKEENDAIPIGARAPTAGGAGREGEHGADL